MPNARNLNYVLGSIGQAVQGLSRSWGTPVPPIQCLVVNRATGLPGEGIGWFLSDKSAFAGLPRSEQRAIVKFELGRVFTYPHWRKVLSALSLSPALPPLGKTPQPVYGIGGESPEHKALKQLVASNPQLVGLPVGAPPGSLEELLLSGDCLDVSFRHGDTWLAVEVKSEISALADVLRGLFQCVKYHAVMSAQSRARAQDLEVRVVLALGSSLPAELVALRNMLAIEVFERVGHSASQETPSK